MIHSWSRSKWITEIFQASRSIHSFKAIVSTKDETTWVPLIGAQHTLKLEPLNDKDGNAVAVVRLLLRNLITDAKHTNTVSKEDEIVGHIPLQCLSTLANFETKDQ